MQRVEAFFGLTVGFADRCIGHGGVSCSSNGYRDKAILGDGGGPIFKSFQVLLCGWHRDHRTGDQVTS